MILSQDVLTDYKVHESIETLSIWSFYKIINEKKYDLLIIEGRPAEDVLLGAWDTIFNQYFEEAGVKTPQWKDFLKLDDLIHKYRCLSGLLDILCKVDSNYQEAVEALKKWNYHIRPNEPLEKEVKRLYKGLESLWTKIQLQESQIEKPKKQAKLNIWQESIRLKKHFKFDIDVKNTTCIEWIHLNKQYVEDIKRKNNGKRGN